LDFYSPDGSYTLSEPWSGVNFADLMAAQGTFGTNFYDRSILRPKHRAYYRAGRPLIKIVPKGALGSHDIRPIHSAPSLGQSIVPIYFNPNTLIMKESRIFFTISLPNGLYKIKFFVIFCIINKYLVESCK